VNKQQLTRECFGEQLAMHLPELKLEAVASARELQEMAEVRSLALVVLHTHGASVTNPDVAEELSLIAQVAPSEPLAVLSDLDSIDEIAAAFELGVRGYVPTHVPIRQAVAAIRLVGHGATYIPSCVLSSTMPPKEQESPSQPRDDHGHAIGFSPRQRQILEGLWQGKQNKMIAFDLRMSESTVKVHIRSIMKKLNARNRTQVVLLTQKIMKDIGASKQSGLRVG
jgi:DNA-binding NarL/FixJ family response regulator